MKLLLDAHFAFWLALKPDKLSPRERALLLDQGHELAVPSIAIWELQIKWERRFVSGERKLEASPKDVVTILEAAGVTLLDFTCEHALLPLIRDLPHKDPFDALMLSLAIALQRKLVTRDGKMKDHPWAVTAA